MKLYYAIPSTYSQKVLIAFYEKGIDVEKVSVNLMDASAKQQYRSDVYQLGKIPLLLADDGHMVPESSIIIEYLEQTFPDTTRLFPVEPVACRQTRFKDRMCDLYLNEAISNLFFQSIKPEAEQDAELIEKCRYNASFMYARMNESLENNEFLAGEAFTIADCAAIPPLFYAQKLQPFSEYEALQTYFNRVQTRPSYQAVLEELVPALKAMEM